VVLVTSLSIDWLKPGTPFDRSYSVGNARKEYFSEKCSLDDACHSISVWRGNNMYLCFRGETSNHEVKYYYQKASKRGNDVYRWRVKNRFRKILDFAEENKDLSFIEKSEDGCFCSHVLKLTLTVDPGKFSLNDFNSRICSKELDKQIKRIRNVYPDVKVSRTYEVFTDKAKGFLHVNQVLFFPSFSFPVFLHVTKKNQRSWRLKNRKDRIFFQESWGCGFVDVRAVSTAQDLLEYCLKYHIKYFKNRTAKGNQDLTLSVLTLFNKRAFSIPDSFTDAIISYSQSLGVSYNMSRLDIVLHNSLGENSNCQFLGVIRESELGFIPEGWFFVRDEPPPCLLKYQDPQSGKIVSKVYVTLLRRDSGWRMPRKPDVNLGRGSVFLGGGSPPRRGGTPRVGTIG
jgi:hypothetical protein